MMKSPETRPDETQRFGMEVTRIGNAAMQVSSKEGQMALREDIASFVKSEDIPTMFKEQLLSTVAGHAKNAVDRQWAVDRLAEPREAKTEQDIKEGVQRIEDYANEGFIDGIVRDAQIAVDKDRMRKDKEMDAMRSEEEDKVRKIVYAQEIIDNEFKKIAAAEKRKEGEAAEDSEVSKLVTEQAEKIKRVSIVLGEVLDDEGRAVIEALFGIKESPGRTVEEVADDMGLSTERVEKIKKNAVKRLEKFEKGLLDS